MWGRRRRRALPTLDGMGKGSCDIQIGGAALAIGVGCGVAIGAALHDLAMGISIGVAIGIALGAVTGPRRRGRRPHGRE